MDGIDQKQLADLITKEILQRMGAAEPAPPAAEETGTAALPPAGEPGTAALPPAGEPGTAAPTLPPAGEPGTAALPPALLVGEAGPLPGHIRGRYRLVPLAGQAADCGACEAVLITALTLTQLADLALGRNEGPVQQAVLEALLADKPVLLLEAALPHRAHRPRKNRPLAQLYEGYLRALEGFGVTLIKTGAPTEKYAAEIGQGAGPAQTIKNGLVTEADARRLAGHCGGTLRLPRGTVLTPSARDVLLHAKCTVEFV